VDGFRPDLYHRLATISLWLPPLRERGGDVLQLAAEFLARACGDYGRPQKTLTPEAQAAIAGYRWPGNIRELANAMERVALMTDAVLVDRADLALPGSPERPAPASGDAPAVMSGFTDSLYRFERAQLIAALDVSGWNVVRAAQQLGVPRTTLRHRIAKYRLARGGVTPHSPVGRPGANGAAAKLTSLPPAVLREERTVALLQASIERIGPAAMEILIEKVEGFGGQLVEIASSGFLAAFGVPPVEDAPSCAARAALAVRNAFAQGVREHASWPGDPPGAVIALHAAGVLTESPVGALSQFQIVVPPQDPCRLVLEDLLAGAGETSIRVSPTIAPFLERRCMLAPLESASVLLGLEPSGLGLAGRPLSRLVGRQDELGMLRALFERAESGQGQVVGLIGEPGVGKSRLVYEFRESLARPPVTYLEGHCLSSARTTPYGPVLELIRQALGTSEPDGPPVTTEKVDVYLQSLGIESETSAPYLLDLLGVKTGAAPFDQLGAEAIKLRTFETLRGIWLRLSRQGPLVLVVEDFQWIDPTSGEYLATLVNAVAGARILLLMTYRPESEMPGLAHSHVSQLAVSRLSPRASLALVRDIASDQLPVALAEAIVEKAAGNPFFLEELTWSAVTERGHSASVSVTGTVADMLRARIDRLRQRTEGHANPPPS
jgi:transposase-like protein